MPGHPAVVERLARLQDDQRIAATAPPGPVLCVAPAGSGKTTTLVARIAWLIDEGDGWTIVDVRASDLRAEHGRVPGAVHAPLNVLEWRVDPASGSQDPGIAGQEDRLILFCQEGYSSSLAAVRLQELGYPNTTDVIGGFHAWSSAGLPVERD